jgi:atypical dual specificity phosphatase
MKEGGKVYIHCSAGIYRSPQMIVLYLTLFEGYALETALETVRTHHPFARPNSEVIKEVIGSIQSRGDRHRVYA